VSRYISDFLRKLVGERANYHCEYCRLPESSSFFSFHIDHIVSLKHGGSTSKENLAFCCQICNLNKGSDIATFLADTEGPVRFFNPRTDSWREHFEANDSGLLLAKTLIGESTIKIFKLNHLDSVIERRELIAWGLFPE
jgi:hypothetical protein